MDVKDFISLEALDLAVGESKRLHCPVCRASDEKSFRIRRTESGIAYVCFRGKCGFRGFTGSYPSGKIQKDNNYAKLEYFEFPTEQLSERNRKFISEKYGLSQKEIEANMFLQEVSRPRLVMPILDPMFSKVGYVTKRMSGNSGRKAETYWHKQVPNIHYPVSSIYDGPVVLVEDILSSIRVARYARCRALLGTSLMDNAIDQLRQETNDLILGLDNDMVPTMVKMSRKLGGIFNVKIIVWPKDPKDLPDEEVKGILEKYL